MSLANNLPDETMRLHTEWTKLVTYKLVTYFISMYLQILLWKSGPLTVGMIILITQLVIGHLPFKHLRLYYIIIDSCLLLWKSIYA
jgi:hypothetical protein